MLTTEHVKGFFDYAIERQNILLKRRAGLPKPWTADPVLRQYRFCNVYREDDVVTEWVRDNIRAHYVDKDLVFNLMLARLFNLPSTLERLDAAGVLGSWNKAKAKRALAGIKGPTVNAAYIVIGDPGYSKGDGICEILDDIFKIRGELYSDVVAHNTLEDAVRILGAPRRMGAFLAYEVACDLRYTPVLANATDIMTWANPGPGAARGLSRMVGQHKHFFNSNGRADRATMNELMRELLMLSKRYLPKGWKPWEMREVEHTLCEYDKYLRAKTGEGRPKQRYPG